MNITSSIFTPPPTTTSKYTLYIINEKQNLPVSDTLHEHGVKFVSSCYLHNLHVVTFVRLYIDFQGNLLHLFKQIT